jgi:hypothetical protein
LKTKNNAPIKYENKPTLYPPDMINNQGTKAIHTRRLIQGDGNEKERRSTVRKEKKRFI